MGSFFFLFVLHLTFTQGLSLLYLEGNTCYQCLTLSSSKFCVSNDMKTKCCA